MNRRTSVLIAISIIIIVSLTVVTYLFIQSEEPSTPSWLKLGTYMTYQQLFAWSGHNQTELMTWNITRLQDNFADLQLISYSVQVNASDNSATMSVGEANWTLNVFDREIVNATDSSYVGNRCPFWIEPTAGIGSTVDSLYGETTIVRNETINVLGQQRDCWVTQQNWPTSSMTRWYDKSTGIVLIIHVRPSPKWRNDRRYRDGNTDKHRLWAITSNEEKKCSNCHEDGERSTFNLLLVLSGMKNLSMQCLFFLGDRCTCDRCCSNPQALA